MRVLGVDAVLVAPGYWSVTVAAQVQGFAEGRWENLGVRYYDVGVVEHAGRYVATGLPAEAPSRRRPPSQRLAVPSPGTPAPGDPQADTVSHFLAALLCGQGELDRYTPAGAALRAVSPAPFATVSVKGIAAAVAPGPARATAGRPAWVEAQVTATDTAGRAEHLDYTLELADSAGQWEVTALLAAPPLAAASS